MRQEVLNRERGGSGRWPQTGAAAFGYGGAAEVVAGRGAFDPFGFTAAGLPLNPLPMQRGLGLRVKENTHYKRLSRLFSKHLGSTVPQRCRSTL